ncbi:MAG TPA: error-prone DNA polymerase, partial [Verrucomicrobiales bacterium]|nr:error-prone DNA polymerase [Verrucomicrobiales bacterium]
LAEVGALNGLAEHRRDALWQVERAVDEGDLFYRSAPKQRKSDIPVAQTGGPVSTASEELGSTGASPYQSGKGVLPAMTPAERLQADYKSLHLSVGPHPMAYLRPQLRGILRSTDLPGVPAGRRVRIAGQVICRQRPGTAKGNMFISLEDETGISNAFVPSKTFETNRLVITQENFLIIEGRLQNSQNVISVLADRIEPLHGALHDRNLSHDFH